MMLILVVLFAFGLHYFFLKENQKVQKQRISPLEILNRRYEAGEITAAEYLVLLNELQ